MKLGLFGSFLLLSCCLFLSSFLSLLCLVCRLAATPCGGSAAAIFSGASSLLCGGLLWDHLRISSPNQSSFFNLPLRDCVRQCSAARRNFLPCNLLTCHTPLWVLDVARSRLAPGTWSLCLLCDCSTLRTWQSHLFAVERFSVIVVIGTIRHAGWFLHMWVL